MSIAEVIRKKRDGEELSEEEIQYFISRVIAGKDRVHDAQIGAFLMAAFLNGMTNAETTALIRSMTYSGFTFMWPVEWKGSVVDKHSTGGVGDKVSLPLAPALAACGLRVPMISGRGLDFTGGTLDKLESIPGFRVSLSKEGMRGMLERVGCCIVGQTEEFVPADKILYAIRDTTSTVDNDNLITASIISKKAAEGLDSLVLDVKTGRGAVMKEIEQSRALAQKMVAAGNLFGMKMSAFITNMDAPLGKCIGNALEVAESVECLRGGGPDDLRDLVLLFGGKLLESVGRVESLEAGKKLIGDKLKDGTALDKFKEMMMGQGTEGRVAEELCHGDIWKVLPKATRVKRLTAATSGYLWGIDALALGKYCHALGCGRLSPGGPVLYEPGILLGKHIGDVVQVGDVLMEVHLPNGGGQTYPIHTLIQHFTISPDKPPKYNLVLDLIA